MAQLGKAHKDQLTSLMREIKRLEKRLQSLHKKTGYEDLGHGVLALQIAEHTVPDSLDLPRNELAPILQPKNQSWLPVLAKEKWV